MQATVLYIGVTFWCTALAFLALTDSLAGRYLLHVYSPGYVLLPLLLMAVGVRLQSLGQVRLRRLATVGSIALLVVVVGFSVGRTMWRLDHPVMNADFHAAMAYVAERHEPGQPVIVALPPVAYLSLGEEHLKDIYFLAGPAGEPRAEEYSRVIEDGRRIDYWVGADAIVSADQLRDLLEQHPDALVVVDSYRLASDDVYRGEIADVIREMTSSVYRGPGGVLVLMVSPPTGDR